MNHSPMLGAFVRAEGKPLTEHDLRRVYPTLTRDRIYNELHRMVKDGYIRQIVPLGDQFVLTPEGDEAWQSD